MDKKAEILDRAARKAIMNSNIEKNANIFRRTKDFMGTPLKAKKGDDMFTSMTPNKLLGIVAAGVIINQFVKKLISAGENAGIKMQSPVFYKKMLKAHPQLLEKDQEDVAKLWDTLYQTAPHLAKDPIAAGGWITQSINADYLDDHGAPPIDTYKALADLEGKIQDNRDSDAANAFGAIAGALSAGALG